jgi:GDP-4-dehydro-6-deoxy-D-mannose reductase
MTRRALLTGGAGFVGRWLALALLERGDEVTLAGLGSLSDGTPELGREALRSIRWISADVRVQREVDAMVDFARPDVIYHLAGVAFPPQAERDPASAYDINSLGVARLLAAVQRQRDAGELDPTVLVVGSATQYGAHEAADMPLVEHAPQRPATIYAASKAAQEIIGLRDFYATGLRVVCTRSFNHSGVGHAADYLLPSLVRRVKAMPRGAPSPVTIGNDVIRDYLHVSDVAAAYIALAERGRAGEAYNVCSGIGVSVRQLATDVLLRAGLSPDISMDPSLSRTADIPVLIGSPAKLQRDTGWAPRKTHADIIDDLLNAPTD